MLTIEHLYKSYARNKIIHDITLSIPQGTIAFLIGGSGVGKSTVLRILSGIESADSGAISLHGKPLNSFTTHTVGMVFQHFNLFDHLTVIENITLGMEKVLGIQTAAAQDTATHLLEKYGLINKAFQSPATLSGGQKQRLAIARAVAMKPQIICMDEPTSALDPLFTDSVATAIRELAHDGYTVVVATHDTVLVKKLACTIYLMEAGRIAATAASQNIEESPQIFSFLNQ